MPSSSSTWAAGLGHSGALLPGRGNTAPSRLSGGGAAGPHSSQCPVHGLLARAPAPSQESGCVVSSGAQSCSRHSVWWSEGDFAGGDGAPDWGLLGCGAPSSRPLPSGCGKFREPPRGPGPRARCSRSRLLFQMLAFEILRNPWCIRSRHCKDSFPLFNNETIF